MSATRNALVVIAGLGMAYAIQTTQPGYADITAPFVTTGAPGSPIVTSNFELEVTGVKAARRLRQQGYGKAPLLTTDGIWVLVAVKAKARTESLTLASATWRGPSGSLYKISDRIPAGLGLLAAQRLEPGLESQGLLVFEIPRGELDGAMLTVTPNAITPLGGEAAIAMPSFGDDKIVEEFDLDAK